MRSNRESYYDAEKGLWMDRVYCASCGKPCGSVNREMVFAFITCNACDEKYGVIAGLAHDPDHVWRQRVADAVAANKEIRTPEDFLLALQNPTSELSKIAKDWQDAPHVRLRR